MQAAYKLKESSVLVRSRQVCFCAAPDTLHYTVH